jgi:hypothetical protein
MSAEQTFPDPGALARHLFSLKAARDLRVASQKETRPKRTPLSQPERDQVLLKSGARCHICGGPIDGQAWQADHVFALSAGGTDSLDNYLPAHSLCNNYRWHYDAEEFQWILKLGVWLRTQIEEQTSVGLAAAAKFVAHDQRRALRRKPGQPPAHPPGLEQL